MLQSSRLGNRFKKIEKKTTDLKNDSTVDVFEDKKDALLMHNENQADIDLSKIETEYKILLINKIETIPVWFEYSSEQQGNLISTFIVNKLSEDNIFLSEDLKNKLIDNIISSILGFGPVDYLVKQNNVDAIFINALNSVHIEIAGKILNTEIKLSSKQLDLLLKHIKNIAELKPEENSFIWNCKSGNLFINAVLPPVAESGANILIRKIYTCESPSDLISKGICSQDIFEYIVYIANTKKNIIVSGDVSVGKTFFVDSLVKLALSNKRGVIVQDYPQMLSLSDTLMKFYFSSFKSIFEYQKLISELMLLQPDFIVIDSNNPHAFNSSVYSIEQNTGAIITSRGVCIDNVVSKFVKAISCESNCSEKNAKLTFLNNFDYIIHIEKCSDGVKRVTAVIELSNSKTVAASFKVIAKWVDNHYEIDIPQPLTSIKAESFVVRNPIGTSLKDRFSNDFVSE